MQIQETLRDRVILKKTFSKVKTIGGGDVGYAKKENILMGVVVVFSFPDMVRLDLASVTGKITFPYIPGLLSFREGPVLIESFKRLKLKPDLMIFEGQGIAHPRGFGLASHLGLWLDIPSIGCAKTPLIRGPMTVKMKKGDFQYVRKDEKDVGVALRTKENVKPVFVSPGHKIDLPTSIRLVLAACQGYRMPEPLRQADQFGRFVIKQTEKIIENLP